jgi:hypothetical protein
MSDPRTANDAAIKLYEIAKTIHELEGMPVDYGLARELSSVLKRIEESCDQPTPTTLAPNTTPEGLATLGMSGGSWPTPAAQPLKTIFDNAVLVEPTKVYVDVESVSAEATKPTDSELASELAGYCLDRMATHLGIRGAELDQDCDTEHFEKAIAELRKDFGVEEVAAPVPPTQCPKCGSGTKVITAPPCDVAAIIRHPWHDERDVIVPAPTNPTQELTLVGQEYACFGGKYYTLNHPECVIALIRALQFATPLHAPFAWKEIMAQKQAEISRLTAELKGIGEALMIVWDGECWEVGFENKPDGFPTLVEACQALYKDADAVQKAKEELEAVNASLKQQLKASQILLHDMRFNLSNANGHEDELLKRSAEVRKLNAELLRGDEGEI